MNQNIKYIFYGIITAITFWVLVFTKIIIIPLILFIFWIIGNIVNTALVGLKKGKDDEN